MVAKISIGSSLYGALSYNGTKMNRDEGRVLGANKIILPADGHINIARMVENFNLFMPKTGRTKKPVLHISLNPHPDDKLTEQQYEILAREYLEKLGFGEQPYIIYKHMDIDRHHIHIVTVNVNEQGKRLNQDFLFRRSKKITTELEEKYNLHKAQREKISPDTPIRKIDPSGDIKRQVANTVKMVGMRYKFQTLGEYNAILSLYNVKCEPADGRFERTKEKIEVAPTKRKVDDALTVATDKSDFIAKLKERNIDVVLRYNDGGRIYGVTFIDHNTMTVLNGSQLGKEFSANAINERFNNPENAPVNTPDIVAPTFVLPIEPTHEDSHSDTTQEPEDNPPSQSTSGQQQSTVTQSVSDFGDYDLPIPGLDLFQQGLSFNPDEEEFRRRMQRKKKKGHRPKF